MPSALFLLWACNPAATTCGAGTQIVGDTCVATESGSTPTESPDLPTGGSIDSTPAASHPLSNCTHVIDVDYDADGVIDDRGFGTWDAEGRLVDWVEQDDLSDPSDFSSTTWTYDGDGQLTSYMKAMNGTVYWQITYDYAYDNGRLLEVLVTSTYEDQTPSLTLETMIWSDEVLIGLEGDWNLDGIDWTESYIYDAAGNVVEEEEVHVGSSMYDYRTYRDFDSAGRVVREEIWDRQSDDWRFYEIEVSTYDAQGMLVASEETDREDGLPSWLVDYTTTYSPEGRPQQLSAEAFQPYYWDENGYYQSYDGNYAYSDGEVVLAMTTDAEYSCP